MSSIILMTGSGSPGKILLMECNRVCLYFSDQCQVQNGGLRLVSMQGASAGINATTDYGSQTFTQDDTSQLVTSSSVAMPINRHLAAVVAMNGHVKGEGGRGTDTPPPPCSTPPPTYEQAILGGACIARRQHGKKLEVDLGSICTKNTFRVPTRTRKHGKIGRHFQSGNFEQSGKVRENLTKYWKSPGISDKCYLLFFSNI